MSRLIIVSNRVSAVKARSEDTSQGGLAVALTAALRESDGIWFGWSGESTERFDGKISMASAGGVTTATVDLEEQDVDEYYNGYANRTLWPLFHYRIDLAEFDRQFGEGYERVNEGFAETLSGLIGERDKIWVHDYHLIPLAQQLRQRDIGNPIGFFLHTPWPPHRLLTALPFHKRLVESLLEYDLIGFQTREWQESFLHYLGREIENCTVEGGTIRFNGRVIESDVFPIGIDKDEFVSLTGKPGAMAAHDTVISTMRGRACIIGVDRLDYSKGLIERFRGYRRFLEEHPEYRRQVEFLQIAPPSRGEVHTYASIREELDQLSGRINGQFSEVDWSPIRYVNQGYQRAELAGLYRAADVALVTPLRDGMNLVAKEYVAAQDEEDPGVLILSKFAGAAEQMTDALLVNPYSKDDLSDRLHQALSMDLDERKARWRSLMGVVRQGDVHDWWRAFVSRLEECRQPALC
ncbi:MAG TPA: alpha,alpha-trehalose-phosphate synthase (UDP-forming) [Sphingomicrobium sp.]